MRILLQALLKLLAVMLAGFLVVTPAAAAPAGPTTVIEHLRLKVPADRTEAWLAAEAGSWEPWLRAQDGFLGRQLYWDPEREEGVLHIAWASRDQWHRIPSRDLDAVQQRFEDLGRSALADGQTGNPFPLVYEGELVPLSTQRPA